MWKLTCTAAIAIIVVSVSAGSASVAWAEDGSTSPTPTSEWPSSITLDRGDNHSRFEIASSIVFFDGEDPDFNNRLDFHGQYIAPSGAGGYVTLPLSYFRDEGESASAIGNLEVGGLYVAETSQVPVTLRAGLTLPTADDDPEGVAANILTAFTRITDLVVAYPETTSLRLSASTLLQNENVYLRADAGLDIALDTPDNVEIDPLVRINFAAGIKADSLAFSAELATLGTTGDLNGGDASDRFIHTLALGVHGRGDSLRPYLGLVVPLDEESDFIEFMVTGGVQFLVGN